MERTLVGRHGHPRPKLPNPTLVPIYRTRSGHTQSSPRLTSQSKTLSIRDTRWTIQFQQNTTGSCRNQGTHPFGPISTQNVAKPCTRCLVRRTSKESLSQLQIFHSIHQRLPNLRICKVFPTHTKMPAIEPGPPSAWQHKT
eukprot:CCRYP_018889-RA/>CCRYP_018889-RA protein AED:0.44 eAED:1.00 QI:0/-1/0/1/-1/0/1/0/140